MKILLIINAIFEGVVGLLFIINPKLAPHLAAENEMTLLFVGMYGFAAVTISVLSILLLLGFHHQELLSNGLFLLTAFHLGIFISQFLHQVDPEMSTPPKIFHGVLFLCFLYFYIRER